MDSSGWTTQRQHDVGQEQLKNPTQQTMCETFMDTSRKSGKRAFIGGAQDMENKHIAVELKAAKEDYKTPCPALLSNSSLVEK